MALYRVGQVLQLTKDGTFTLADNEHYVKEGVKIKVVSTPEHSGLRYLVGQILNPDYKGMGWVATEFREDGKFPTKSNFHTFDTKLDKFKVCSGSNFELEE